MHRDISGSFSNFSPDPPPQRAMGGPPSTSSSSRPRWNRQWSKELEDRIHRAGVASTASMGAEDLDGAEDPADDLAGDADTACTAQRIPVDSVRPQSHPITLAPRASSASECCPSCLFRYPRPLSKFCSRCGAKRVGLPRTS
eukprot:EG_transcript_1265